MAKAKPDMKMDDMMCQCCNGPWRWTAVVLMAIIVPVLFIWALDTLFGLTITYTVYTWFAALIVVTVLGGKGWEMWMGHQWCACSAMHKGPMWSGK